MGTKMALSGAKLSFLLLKWHFWATFRGKLGIFTAKMALLGTKMALSGAKMAVLGTKLALLVLKWHF